MPWQQTHGGRLRSPAPARCPLKCLLTSWAPERAAPNCNHLSIGSGVISKSDADSFPQRDLLSDSFLRNLTGSRGHWNLNAIVLDHIGHITCMQISNRSRKHRQGGGQGLDLVRTGLSSCVSGVTDVASLSYKFPCRSKCGQSTSYRRGGGYNNNICIVAWPWTLS